MNCKQDLDRHAFVDLFGFANGGFEGEDVNAGFLVGEEAGLPTGVVDLGGYFYGAEGFAFLFGSGLPDFFGDAFGDGDEGPGGFALPEPDVGGEGVFFHRALRANLRCME